MDEKKVAGFVSGVRLWCVCGWMNGLPYTGAADGTNDALTLTNPPLGVNFKALEMRFRST